MAKLQSFIGAPRKSLSSRLLERPETETAPDEDEEVALNKRFMDWRSETSSSCCCLASGDEEQEA